MQYVVVKTQDLLKTRSGILSNLGLKTPLNEIPLLGDILRQNYSACGPFTKNKERIQKFIETGDTKYIYRNELDKACFQHDMAYADFKDLARRTDNI